MTDVYFKQTKNFERRQSSALYLLISCGVMLLFLFLGNVFNSESIVTFPYPDRPNVTIGISIFFIISGVGLLSMMFFAVRTMWYYTKMFREDKI